MRTLRASLLAVVLGLGVSAPAGAGERAARDLPASITLTTGKVTYRIAPNLRVTRVANPPSAFPADAAFQGDGVWFATRDRHLVIGHGRTALWRSRGAFGPSNRAVLYRLGRVLVGTDAVAFSYANNLYMAKFNGEARLIARSEVPLGFTADGLYTYKWNRRLLLRSATGAIVSTIARWPFNADIDVLDGNLYFVSQGALMRADGAIVQRLASLSRLGLSTNAGLQTIGPLLQLEDNHRLVVLRPDGSVFARAPQREWRAGSVSSSLVPAPDGRAVAFAASAGQGRGTEIVYLLRAGAHAATPLHSEPVTFNVCERGASVEWHGTWLLYTNSESNIVALDTTGARRAVDLSALARSLRGAAAGATAYWTGQPPQF